MDSAPPRAESSSNMLHPAAIVFIAFLYGVEYFFRFYRTRNYIHAGKGLARFLLMGVYLWVWIADPSELLKIFYIRWSIFMLLSVDVFYIGQTHVMRWKRDHGR